MWTHLACNVYLCKENYLLLTNLLHNNEHAQCRLQLVGTRVHFDNKMTDCRPPVHRPDTCTEFCSLPLGTCTPGINIKEANHLVNKMFLCLYWMSQKCLFKL